MSGKTEILARVPRFDRARRSRAGMVDAFMVSLLLLGACSKDDSVVFPSDPGNKPKHKPQPNFATPWQTESEYVVIRIVTELANFYAFSREHKALPSSASAPNVTLTTLKRVEDSPVFHVRVDFGGGKVAEGDVATHEGIFTVGTYGGLASQMEHGTGPDLVRDSGTLADEPETILLQNKADALQRLDVEVSSQLEAHFDDPKLHEEAALLVEALSWSDCSGKFFNLLPELCRITAHRVFAAALRKGDAGGPLETLNRGMADDLMGLQADAIAAADALPHEAPYPAWSRIVRIRASGDFRILGEASEPAPLEEVEAFRSFSRILSPDIALHRYTLPTDPYSRTAWWRILNTYGPSVSTGHILLENALKSEVFESTGIYVDYTQEKLADSAALVRALNAPEANVIGADAHGAVHVSVLGWNMWAQLLQRQVCYAIADDCYFLASVWGVPDKANQYLADVDAEYGGLTLYPLVRRFDAVTEKYYHDAQDQSMKLVRSNPQLVPALAWNLISYPVSFCPLYIPPPHPFINEWHRDNPLPGTVYDLEPRLDHPSMNERDHIVEVSKRLHKMAPYLIPLTNFYLTRETMKEPSAEDAIRGYGPILEYTPYVIRYISQRYAAEGNGAKEIEWLRKAAGIDPTADLELAQVLKMNNYDDDAAAAYEVWMANETDSVLKANNSMFLVAYYEHHGRSAEATALAEKAAEVGSYAGMQTKGYLLEDRKQYADALQCYLEMADRYQAPGLAIGFLLGHQKDKGGPLAPETLDRLIKANFPEGLHLLDPKASTPPTEGMLVSFRDWQVDKAGLKVGDIVIGARGYAVSDYATFFTITSFTWDDPCPVVVWRQGKQVALPPWPVGFQLERQFPAYHK